MTKKIIVADDHPSWREMYVRLVQDAFPNVYVDSVETGSELVKRVLQEDYSVVISDNDMEEHGAGLKALQAIREAGKQVPFYIYSRRSIANEALRLGANGFYNKAQFDSNRLIADIKQYLVDKL